MANLLATPLETDSHRVVVAANTAACATCGTTVYRRREDMTDAQWEGAATWAAEDHERFPVAAPPDSIRERRGLL